MTIRILTAHATEFGVPYITALRDRGIAPDKVGVVGADPLVGHIAEVWSYPSANTGDLVYLTTWTERSGVDGVDYVAVVTDMAPSESDWLPIYQAGHAARRGEA